MFIFIYKLQIQFHTFAMSMLITNRYLVHYINHKRNFTMHSLAFDSLLLLTVLAIKVTNPVSNWYLEGCYAMR
jgi:hypothetical protein